MGKLLIGVMLVLFTIFNHALCWVLDKNSCKNYENEVREAVQNAFRIAASAADRLQPQNSHQDPVSIPARALFGENDSEGKKFEQARQRYHNLASHAKETKDLPALDAIVIQCGMGGFKWRDNRKVVSFPQYGFTSDAVQFVDDCLTGTGTSAPLAATFAGHHKSSTEPSLIVICDPYLKKISSGKWVTTFKMDTNFFRKLRSLFKSKPNTPTNTNNYEIDAYHKRPIDQAYLLDSTILHELMHTTASAFQPDPNSDAIEIAKDTAGPGWRRCAQRQDPSNAESLALVATALHFSTTQQDFYVNAQGDFAELGHQF